MIVDVEGDLWARRCDSDHLHQINYKNKNSRHW